MSNHIHLVLRIRPRRADSFSDTEVIRRWSAIYAVPSELDGRSDKTALISTWRARLSSISWFMRALNEPLARIANKEDGCSGRFWEGRFKSQALLDSCAVLRCMAYVDLNPIRAGICERIEDSRYTSIKARLEGDDDFLVRLSVSEKGDDFSLSLRDYLAIIRLSSRHLQRDKQREQTASLAQLLSKVGIEESDWLRSLARQRRWHRLIGSKESLTRYANMRGVIGLRSAWAI